MTKTKSLVTAVAAVALLLGGAGSAGAQSESDEQAAQQRQQGQQQGQQQMRPRQGMGPGMMGQGQMGPGMRGQMPGQGMGQGPMGPGQMGPGMQEQGMGPGMMGQGGSGMMMRGQMGPGMMMGHMGAMGDHGRHHGLRVTPVVSVEDVRYFVERHIAAHELEHLEVGDVEQADPDTITADVVTKEGSLALRLFVDRRTGLVEDIE